MLQRVLMFEAAAAAATDVIEKERGFGGRYYLVKEGRLIVYLSGQIFLVFVIYAEKFKISLLERILVYWLVGMISS